MRLLSDVRRVVPSTTDPFQLEGGTGKSMPRPGAEPTPLVFRTFYPACVEHQQTSDLRKTARSDVACEVFKG